MTLLVIFFSKLESDFLAKNKTKCIKSRIQKPKNRKPKNRKTENITITIKAKVVYFTKKRRETNAKK